MICREEGGEAQVVSYRLQGVQQETISDVKY